MNVGEHARLETPFSSFGNSRAPATVSRRLIDWVGSINTILPANSCSEGPGA